MCIRDSNNIDNNLNNLKMKNRVSQTAFSQRQLRVGELVKQNIGELLIRSEAKIPGINSKLITV